VLVINGSLYQVMLSLPMEPPLLTNAGWVKSIDTTMSGFVALSGLDDGIVHVYSLSPMGELTGIADIDAGGPVSAVTFDDNDGVWIYTEGEIRGYPAPDYEYDACSVFDVSEVEMLGRVDDMVMSIWNHSFYLAIQDGANGTVAEVDYLGNLVNSVSNVLMGPSNYVDIFADNNVNDEDEAGCRICMVGGINRGYVSRLNADLEVEARNSYGYWGIRAAALDMSATNMVVALEDCCTSWIDMLLPPPDWVENGH